MLRTFHDLFSISSFCCLELSCKQSQENSENDAQQPGRDMGGPKTIRSLKLKLKAAIPGYVLFNVLDFSTAHLVNLDGKGLHQWKSKYGPSGGFYLMNDI